MFQVAVGHSEIPDASEAVEEIREQCEEQLAGHRPSAGMVLAAIDFDHQELLAEINEAWPGLELIGCTTDGELSSDLGFLEDSVVLTLFASDTISFKAGLGRNLSADTLAACREAVQMARSGETSAPAFCITTPESLTASGQQIVEGLVSELGEGVPVVGGTAGDQFRIEKTHQFFSNEVLTDSVPLLLLSGPLDVSFAVAGGSKRIGPEGTVTKSEGSLLQEIDGMPAAEFYRNVMGAATTNATESPLAILDEAGEIDYLRAAAGDFDPETGALSMFAETRVGSRVGIAVTDRDSLVLSCGEAAQLAGSRFPAGKKPGVALVFSCAGRKILLGTRTGEEQEALAEVVGDSVPAAGFYTYGEICPSASLEAGARFHNQTFVLALLGERDG